jgi:hypothetical protein
VSGTYGGVGQCVGFEDNAGTITTIASVGSSTVVNGGMNNQRQLLADEDTEQQPCDFGVTRMSYLYNLNSSNSPAATISYGSDGPTDAGGINDDGKAVGSYYNLGAAPGTDPITAFIWDSTTGQFQTFSHSGWSYMYPSTINGFGQIVGQYTDSRGNLHAFLDDNGVFTTINACGGSTATSKAWGINNNEQVLVECGTTTLGYELVYDLVHKTSATIYDPNAGNYYPTAWCESCAADINDAGVVAGTYYDASGVPHGFLATPNPQ